MGEILTALLRRIGLLRLTLLGLTGLLGLRWLLLTLALALLLHLLRLLRMPHTACGLSSAGLLCSHVGVHLRGHRLLSHLTVKARRSHHSDTVWYAGTVVTHLIVHHRVIAFRHLTVESRC